MQDISDPERYVRTIRGFLFHASHDYETSNTAPHRYYNSQLMFYRILRVADII
jgi:hypothetical protein